MSRHCFICLMIAWTVSCKSSKRKLQKEASEESLNSAHTACERLSDGLADYVREVRPMALANGDQVRADFEILPGSHHCFPVTELQFVPENEATSYLWRVCDETGRCFPDSTLQEEAVAGAAQSLWFRSVERFQKLPYMPAGKGVKLTAEVRPCSGHFGNCKNKVTRIPFLPAAPVCSGDLTEKLAGDLRGLLVSQQRYLKNAGILVQTSCDFRKSILSRPSLSQESKLLATLAGNICELRENLTQVWISDFAGFLAEEDGQPSLNLADGRDCQGKLDMLRENRPLPGIPVPADSPQPPAAADDSRAMQEQVEKLSEIYSKIESIENRLSESSGESGKSAAATSGSGDGEKGEDREKEEKSGEPEEAEKKKKSFVADLLVGVGVSFVFAGIPVSYSAVADKIRIRSDEKEFNNTVNEVLSLYKDKGGLDDSSTKTYKKLRSKITDEDWRLRSIEELEFRVEHLSQILPEEPPKSKAVLVEKLNASDPGFPDLKIFSKTSAGEYRVNINKHAKEINYQRLGGGLAVILAGVVMTAFAWDYMHLAETPSGELADSRAYMESSEQIYTAMKAHLKAVHDYSLSLKLSNLPRH